MDEQNMNAEYVDTSAQEYELPDDFDLFGDTNQAEDAQSEQPAEQSAEDTAPAEQHPQTYEVTFNGEKRSLTLEELITNAQKGLNYDHIKERADRADSNAEAAEILAAFAQAAGVSVEQYVAQARDQLSGREVRELTDRGMDEDLAKELLQLRREKENSNRVTQQQAEQQARIDKWNALADHVGGWDKMPFRDASEVPAEMANYLDNGYDPLTAYLLYKEKDTATQLAAAQAAAKNRQRAPGSVSGTASTSTADPFLAGFLS